jgi:hypothetical protein
MSFTAQLAENLLKTFVADPVVIFSHLFKDQTGFIIFIAITFLGSLALWIATIALLKR